MVDKSTSFSVATLFKYQTDTKRALLRFSPLGEWSGRKLRYIRIRFRGCLSCNYTFHCIYLVFIVGSDHLIHQSLYSK